MRWLAILPVLACAFAAPPLSPLARETLAAHNAVRLRVGVPPLNWSDRLAGVARRWAESLVKHRRFEHNPESPYGENLFEIRGAGSSPLVVVEKWAAESANYDPRSGRCRADCGHYTQIVWRNTRQLGCAVARASGREVWVCEYDPPGNVSGQRPY